MPLFSIDWDAETKPYVDNITYLTIRTGWSRAYRNVINGFCVREPARGARLRMDIEALLTEISKQSGEALCVPNVPEFTVVKFDCHQVVVTHGVVYTAKTPGGRFVGDYKLVAAMIDEMDAVLSEVFLLERYVKAALL